MILPLALAQFVASYAATNMNVVLIPRQPGAAAIKSVPVQTGQRS
jgi:hypothetical protein